MHDKERTYARPRVGEAGQRVHNEKFATRRQFAPRKKKICNEEACDGKTRGRECTVKIFRQPERFPNGGRTSRGMREQRRMINFKYRIRNFNSNGISREVNRERCLGGCWLLWASRCSPPPPSPLSPPPPLPPSRILWLRACFLAENRRPPESASSEFRPPKYFPHFHIYS